MRYTKKQFLKDVAKEAKALKKNATKEELCKLDFDDFNGRQYDQCIYGQMTGTCFSRRASALILDCCAKYFVSDVGQDIMEVEIDQKPMVKTILKYVNGRKPEDVNSPEELYRHRNEAYETIHYSSIEAYIMWPESKPENLIAYLKGERKDLVL